MEYIIKCYHNLKNKNHNSILINFFCDYLEDLHIQEAADHAVIYLEHHFRPDNIKYSNGISLLYICELIVYKNIIK